VDLIGGDGKDQFQDGNPEVRGGAYADGPGPSLSGSALTREGEYLDRAKVH